MADIKLGYTYKRAVKKTAKQKALEALMAQMRKDQLLEIQDLSKKTINALLNETKLGKYIKTMAERSIVQELSEEEYKELIGGVITSIKEVMDNVLKDGLELSNLEGDEVDSQDIDNIDLDEQEDEISQDKELDDEEDSIDEEDNENDEDITEESDEEDDDSKYGSF